jgi:hypothetical protein
VGHRLVTIHITHRISLLSCSCTTLQQPCLWLAALSPPMVRSLFPSRSNSFLLTSHTDTTSASISASTSTSPETPSQTTLPFDGYSFIYSHSDGTLVMGNTNETLTAGGPALITAGHTISVATEGVYIDGTLDITSTSLTPPQTVTFDSLTTTASEVESGVWAVYTATLTAGGDAKTVLGQEVTAASSGLVVATSSQSASSTTATSSTSGAEKVAAGCWTGLIACGVLFSLL